MKDLCAADARPAVAAGDGEGGAWVFGLEPVHHCLDAVDVGVGDVVFLAEPRGHVDMGDVVAGGRVDAVQRLQKDPVAAEVFRNAGEVGAGVLYALTYFSVGYLSRDFLATLEGFHQAGRAMEVVIFSPRSIVYAIYRISQFLRFKKYRIMPRVQVQELAARLASDKANHVQIVDVRSHGYYDIGAERIKGSIRIEPNNLDEEITADLGGRAGAGLAHFRAVH